MDRPWRDALRLVRTVSPGFKAKYKQDGFTFLSHVDTSTREISYGVFVRLNIKNRFQTIVHEMCHLLLADLCIPSYVHNMFPNLDTDYENYAYYRQLLPLSVSRATTRYGATHPEEDLVEAMRLTLQNLDAFPQGSIQEKKCKAVKRWLNI